MFALLFSVLLVASETASTGTPPSQPSATNEAGEATKQEKKICKRQPVTGQIQGTKRICMTLEQWKRVQEADQRRR